MKCIFYNLESPVKSYGKIAEGEFNDNNNFLKVPFFK